MIDEKDGELDLGRNPKSFYENKMQHMKFFAKNFYRTYKTSNIRRFIKLDMDIEYLKEHAASVSHNIQRTIYLTNDTVKYRLY